MCALETQLMECGIIRYMHYQQPVGPLEIV